MPAPEQLLVAALVTLALWYVVRKQWRRYFNRKPGCGGDCSCGAKDLVKESIRKQR